MNAPTSSEASTASVSSPGGDSALTSQHFPVVVIGGGPAGLTGAYEVLKRSPGMTPLVVESGQRVGGIARTEEYKGYRFDIGGHRFFTKVKPVEDLWHEIMGDEMIDVPRSSRIYYRGKFYDYPLSIGNALGNLGLYESARVAISFAKWKVFPSKVEENFEQWVSNRFGGRLYWHFFRTYTEKVWGIPPTEIRADWAAQRIKDLSLTKAVVDALTGKGDTASLIKTFKYPRLGPGQMWERAAEIIEERGGQVRLNTRATRIHREGNRVTSVDMTNRSGERYSVSCDHLMTTMPITELVRSITPVAPDHVLKAAGNLKYRDFLIVTLVLDHADPFTDNWIYIHSPEVKVGRIQNFRAWSPAMLPNQNTASIGMEYFCHEGDGLWSSTNEQLLELAKSELERLELAPAASVIDGTVIRQPKAYPVYDADYKANVEIIRDWLLTFENLQSVGRNGMHRYNNQDHSMLAAMLAAHNILGESHDIWSVNVERSYHEEFVVDKKKSKKPDREASSAGEPSEQELAACTVIVPAYNAGRTLEVAVRALLDSSSRPAEILIADDGSTDGSALLATELHPSVRCVRVGESPSGPAAARNRAAEEATEDIIAFVDADVRVHPDTLKQLIAPLENDPRTVACFGSYDDRPESSKVPSVYANIRHHHVHQMAPEEAQTFWSGLGAVRRSAFVSTGGYDAGYSQPSIEDIELGLRLRKLGRIRVVHGAQATHLKQWSLTGLWRTDVFRRALPWAKLSVNHPELAGALNSSKREKLSAALIGLALIMMLALPWLIASLGAIGSAPLVLVPACLWLWMNRQLIGLLHRRGGLAASIGGSLLHGAYYIYSVPVFLAASAWYKWIGYIRTGQAQALLAVVVGVALASTAGIGLFLLVLGFVDSGWLLERVSSLERDASDPRYSLDSLAGVQRRLLLVGMAVLIAALTAVFIGPRAILLQARESVARLRETVVFSRIEMASIGILTLAFATFGFLFINQQMRLDETYSFAMFATTTPLVALGTYETPNNHILNSVLMWLSVRLFGPTEWAARLPAYFVSLLIPLGILATGRTLLSPMIGMIAAGLFVGSTIGTDIATNARGYPIMIVTSLWLLALLPALREQRPGAKATAVALGVVGMYAVPVMAYPLAIAYATLLLAGPSKGQKLPTHVSSIVSIGIATLALSALLYSPAWAMQTGSGPLDTLTRVAGPNDPSKGYFRLGELTYNLHAAWSQWTWPAPSLIAIGIFSAAIIGVWMWITRPGWPRALLAGLAFGVLGVYVVTRFAPPPWWVLVWFVPLLCMMLATPLAYLAVLISPRPVIAPLSGIVCAGLLASSTLLSDYPAAFPYWVGCRDAPAIADTFTPERLEQTHVITRTQWFRQFNFELEKRSLGRSVALRHDRFESPTKEYVAHIRSLDSDNDSELDRLDDSLDIKLEYINSVTFGGTVVDTYRVIPQPSQLSTP